jgi:hypothetical protein
MPNSFSAAARRWRRSATLWRDISGGIVGLSFALALAGAGSSTQHPLPSAAVSGAYGRAARRPLGIYNFTGDLGKAAIPALMSLLLVSVAWQQAVFALAAAGIAVSVAMALWMPAVGMGHAADAKERSSKTGESRGGFYWLLAIGMLDSAVRMGFLTFLPFLLIAKERDASHQRFGSGTSLHRRSRRQVRLRLAGRQDRHPAHRVLHRNMPRPSDPRRFGAAAHPGDRAPAGAGGDAQRHVVGAVWNGPRTDPAPSHRACLRFVLYRHHRRGRRCPDSLWFSGRRVRTGDGNGRDRGRRWRSARS